MSSEGDKKNQMIPKGTIESNVNESAALRYAIARVCEVLEDEGREVTMDDLDLILDTTYRATLEEMKGL